ncbi:hypothetical protein ACWEVP_11415 [Amycolatopsis sp. NPDC003865]
MSPAVRVRTRCGAGTRCGARTGIPPEALDLLDTVVEIPMVGTGASLVLYKLAGLL